MESDQRASASPSTTSPSPLAADVSHDASEHEQYTSPTSSDALHDVNSQPLQPPPSLVHQSSSEGSPAEAGRHPRGKRKRTTARDKDILEEEYRKNSKPDKDARAEIVKRVSLTEKEVQIWFQNRRQNARRKTRPLSPEDLAAIAGGPVRLLSNGSVAPINYAPVPVEYVQAPEQSSSFPSHTDPAGSQFPDGSDRDQDQLQRTAQWGLADSVHRRADEPQQPIVRSFAGEVGYLANRRNIASPAPPSLITPSHLGHDDSFSSESLPSCSPPSAASAALPTPPSSLRLSTSLEGKAEVVPSAFSSPPHPTNAPPAPESSYQQEPLPKLNLHPDRGSITLPPISTLTDNLPLPPASSDPLPPRLTSGRSRDPQAWEYCCLSKNREDPLTRQAKHESSGSAVAEINLIRSTSWTGSTPVRQVVDVKRKVSATQGMPRRDALKKPRLNRSMSSVARMETVLAPAPRSSNIIRRVPSAVLGEKAKPSTEMVFPGHDSDKENWSPDENNNPRSFRRASSGTGTTTNRRPLPSGPSTLTKGNNPRRRTVHGARGSPLLSARALTAPTSGFQYRRRGDRSQSPLRIFEDAEDGSPGSDQVPDDEVERFMRGDVSPSKKGDADAVASLLSLSQGIWR